MQIGEGLAGGSHHAEGRHAAPPQELGLRHAQQVLGTHPLDHLARQDAVQRLGSPGQRQLRQAGAQVAQVEVAHQLLHLFAVEALRLGVLHRLQAEAHVGAAAALVAEHLKPSSRAALVTQRRIGTTPAARWKASSRSICGMLSAIGW